MSDTYMNNRNDPSAVGAVEMFTVNDVWRLLIGDLLDHGREVAPRGQKTKELIAYRTVIPMRNPVITVRSRKLGYRFLSAEAAWILSGDNRVETIAPYSKDVPRYSDDGYSFFGAYGPKFVEQLSYVVDTLYRDIDSRQALMTLWRERPGSTKDVPCTVSLQWLIRGLKLHCIVTMRSSDAWLGWPYDVHTFSMMSAAIAILYRQRYRKLREPFATETTNIAQESLELGDLYLTAGSQHLYERNWEAAAVARGDVEVAHTLRDFDVSEYATPRGLVNHLWRIANRGGGLTAHGFKPAFSWLQELPAVKVDE